MCINYNGRSCDLCIHKVSIIIDDYLFHFLNGILGGGGILRLRPFLIYLVSLCNEKNTTAPKLKENTVWDLYNIVNFLENICNRHPLAYREGVYSEFKM